MKTLRYLVVAATALAWAAPVHAQDVNGVGAYGVLQLESGAFPSDPTTVAVAAGGGVDIGQTIGGLCRGWIAEAPDITLDYVMGGGELYISADADADTTLAVYAPDGFYYCDDDSGGETDPGVYLPKPPGGRYQIWVGTYTAEAGTPPATVYFSEINYIHSMGTTQPENLAQPGANPNFGVVTLAGGFADDPHTVSVRAGGGNAISEELPQCNGYVSVNPDVRLDWTAGSGLLPLIISVAADADTTLLIRNPDGTFSCDDDGGENGMNPSVRYDAAQGGSYEIWVGTFASDVGAPPATLHISELTTQ